MVKSKFSFKFEQKFVEKKKLFPLSTQILLICVKTLIKFGFSCVTTCVEKFYIHPNFSLLTGFQ